MSEVVLIQPTSHTLTLASGRVEALEILLGGTPRGLVLLLADPSSPEIAVIEAMNALAGEGYESLAAVAATVAVGALFDRAIERDWTPEQVGVVGLGLGGSVALDIARTHEVGAVVSFSATPDIADISRSPVLRTPWLGLFGERAVNDQEVRRLRRSLRHGSDVFSQVVVYPGVGADFHRRSETGLGYSASYDGWERTAEWLNARVATRLTPLAVAWRRRQTLAAG
jgi:carboxymethylenebutenolidase